MGAAYSASCRRSKLWIVIRCAMSIAGSGLGVLRAGILGESNIVTRGTSGDSFCSGRGKCCNSCDKMLRPGATASASRFRGDRSEMRCGANWQRFKCSGSRRRDLYGACTGPHVKELYTCTRTPADPSLQRNGSSTLPGHMAQIPCSVHSGQDRNSDGKVRRSVRGPAGSYQAT